MDAIKLPKIVADQFELLNQSELYPKCAFGGWGEVDFENLTLDQAEDLVVRRFPYLRRKGSAVSAAAPVANTQKSDGAPVASKVE
jgi:hypothetical protein